MVAFLIIVTVIIWWLRRVPTAHSTGGTGWYKGGYTEYPGEYVPCLHAPLLSDAEWDKVVKHTGRIVNFK